MTYTRDQILAMDAEQLRLAIAEAKGLDVSEHDEHDWKREPGGDIDLYAHSNDPHSGPYCNRCGYSFCTGCSGDDGYNNGLPCKSYPPAWTESMSSAWELVEEANFIVGPEYSGGFDSIRVGWAVYADWIGAADDTYSMPGSAKALVVEETAPLAIARAWLMWKEGV